MNKLMKESISSVSSWALGNSKFSSYTRKPEIEKNGDSTNDMGQGPCTKKIAHKQLHDKTKSWEYY